MRIARVVGNVVSTIKEETHYGRKMMIIEYLDLDMKPIGTRDIALDARTQESAISCLRAEMADLAKMLFEDKGLISDITICGVLDHYSLDGKIIKTT